MKDIEKQRDIEYVKQALREATTIKNNRVSIINSDPKTRSFVFWFIVSCYFPVITACLGPIANTISIACVVNKWRQVGAVSQHGDDVFFATELKDPRGIFTVNVISLVLGFFSNIVLFLHFARKLSYIKSQFINITGWSIAGFLLLIDCIVCSVKNIRYDLKESKTIGFWYACITSGLYLLCSITLSIHFIGFKLSKYPATFNLLPNERSIMVFTVLFSIWLIWGSIMFSSLLDVSFGDALYYCIVALLTVGFGDIIPLSVASKIMTLIFAMTGIIILGLIVFMTRSIIMKSTGPVWYFHRLEHKRSKLWAKINSGELQLNDKETFELMCQIKATARLRGAIFSALLTVLIFITFWLLGATVFMFSENWSYFNSIYFCFLCLLTIGYGDYAPESAAGRAFFVIWAIGAVPLMSVILSTVGDLFYSMSSSIDKKLSNRMGERIRSIEVIGKNYFVSLVIDKNSTEADYKSSSDNGEANNDTAEEANSDDESIDTFMDRDITTITSNETRLRANRYRRNSMQSINNTLNSLSRQVTAIENSKNLEKAHEHNLHLIPSDNLINTGDRLLQRQKLAKLEDILISLKRLHMLSLDYKDLKLSYEEWCNLHILFPPVKDTLTSQEQKNFWLSDKTPLKFQLNESHYAFLRLYKSAHELLYDLILNEEIVEDNNKSPSNIGSSLRSLVLVDETLGGSADGPLDGTPTETQREALETQSQCDLSSMSLEGDTQKTPQEELSEHSRQPSFPEERPYK